MLAVRRVLTVKSFHRNHLNRYTLLNTLCTCRDVNAPCNVVALPNHAVQLNSSGRSARNDATAWTLMAVVGGASILFNKQIFQQKSHADAQVLVDSPIITPEQHDLVNWSGTHAVSTDRYYTPENLEQLKAIVAEAHRTSSKLRPVGSGLSPNAIGFSKNGMINLALMDSIVSVDHQKKRVTVQAGARISQVVDELRPHGLTLQNFASIMEQQVGGFTQVSAHGTGATIPPVDEQVVAVKLITPAAGQIDLSIDDDDPSLFKLARTSLGLLGVVAELTLQCVPTHYLVERTFTASHDEVRHNHATWLSENKHLRYMWIPHTDTVVVVACNPVSSDKSGKNESQQSVFSTEAHKLAPARQLLKSVRHNEVNAQNIDNLSFTELRDELLSVDPLNKDWVCRVNQAEAEYWKRSEGIRLDMSDRILGFDCGGQQWVSEVAFPVHRQSTSNDVTGSSHVDVEYMIKLLHMIDRENIPAPAPIEQRWSAPSTSPMSPASEKPNRDLPPLYSWVGIIMYLPDASNIAESSKGSLNAGAVASSRKAITAAFEHYKRLCERHLWSDVRAVEHWAKTELPKNNDELASLRSRISDKYPVVAFNAIRELFDPRRILSNELTDAMFGEGHFKTEQPSD